MKLLLFIVLFLPTLIQAKLFTITSCSNAIICTELEDQINAILPNVSNIDALAQGMADASVFSIKGIGADYASNMSLVAFGGSIGLGASLGPGQTLSTLISGGGNGTLPGIGVGSGLLMGLKLGFLKSSFFQNTRAFINFGSLKPPSSYGIGGKFSTFGVHLQYDLMPAAGVGFGLLGFGGMQITAGFETASSQLILSNAISQTSSGTTIKGTAVFETKTSSYSIPLEISANASFLYMFTLFGGLGLDYNWGTTTMATRFDNASLTGTITGTPNLTLSGKASPGAITFRNFIGLQFNLLAAKLAFQLNNGIGNGGIGFVMSGKIVW